MRQFLLVILVLTFAREIQSADRSGQKSPENTQHEWGTNRRWKSDDLMSFCKGKSKKELRYAFGKPYYADSDFWYYHRLWIEDNDAGKVMEVMTILFLGDTAAQVTFMEKGIPGL